MGRPPPSFAADAHDCIMVRSLRLTEYKVVARAPRPLGGLPSGRYPDRTERAVVLEAVKVWPGEAGECCEVGATANFDSFCARRPSKAWIGMKKGLQIEQRNRSLQMIHSSAKFP